VTHFHVRHDSFLKKIHPVSFMDAVKGCTKEIHYGVATIRRLLRIIGLFCRISSLLLGSDAKETYNFKEPTSRSHPIFIYAMSRIYMWDMTRFLIFVTQCRLWIKACTKKQKKSIILICNVTHSRVRHDSFLIFFPSVVHGCGQGVHKRNPCADEWCVWNVFGWGCSKGRDRDEV